MVRDGMVGRIDRIRAEIRFGHIDGRGVLRGGCSPRISAGRRR